MREEELSVLERTRLQAGRVARIRARCDEITPKGAYRSPALTGMPRGGGEICGLDGGKRACEALIEELEREEKTLKHLTRQAEKVIARSNMKAEMREFCRGYYLRRMSVEDAAQSVGLSGRTGWNYKAEIETARRAKKQCKQGKKQRKRTGEICSNFQVVSVVNPML